MRSTQRARGAGRKGASKRCGPLLRQPTRRVRAAARPKRGARGTATAFFPLPFPPLLHPPCRFAPRRSRPRSTVCALCGRAALPPRCGARRGLEGRRPKAFRFEPFDRASREARIEDAQRGPGARRGGATRDCPRDGPRPARVRAPVPPRLSDGPKRPWSRRPARDGQLCVVPRWRSRPNAGGSGAGRSYRGQDARLGVLFSPICRIRSRRHGGLLEL